MIVTSWLFRDKEVSDPKHETGVLLEWHIQTV